MTHTPSPCSQQVRAGIQIDKNLDAGAASKAVQDAAWQIASSDLLSFFSPISYNHLPGDDSAHMGWVLPHQITSQENVPQTCLQAGAMEAFSLFRFLVPR